MSKCREREGRSPVPRADLVSEDVDGDREVLGAGQGMGIG